MFAYVARRLGATIVVMAVVAFVVFLLLYLTPGDPAAILAGDAATSQDIASIREALGLNAPFHVRFGEWVWRLLHGDLGISIFTKLPVTRLIGQRVGPTLVFFPWSAEANPDPRLPELAAALRTVGEPVTP